MVRKQKDFEKQHCCYYCGNLQKKISRHLQTVHRSENDVRSVPAENKQRKMALDRLRNMGDFHHNVDVLTKGSGQLILGRRVSADSFTAADFLPCRYCLVFFSKKELWRHVAHCNFAKTPLSTGYGDKSVQRAGQMLLCGAGVSVSSSPSSSAGYMSAIVNLLPNDTVSEQINNDSLLTRYGQILFNKLGLERAADVRCRLRYLARLKLQMSVPGGYETIIKAQHFDAVLAATKELCGVSQQRTLNGCLKLEKPHIALKVGQFLKKITQVRNFYKTLS